MPWPSRRVDKHSQHWKHWIVLFTAQLKSTHLPNSGDVCIVPCVVINKNGSICHCSYLISIIPPRHDFGILQTKWEKGIKATNVIHPWMRIGRILVIFLFCRQDLRGADLRGVVTEPVIGFPEIIKYNAAPIATSGWQHNGGRGVGFTGHPCRVEGVCNKEEGHDQDHPTGNLEERQEPKLLRIPHDCYARVNELQ